MLHNAYRQNVKSVPAARPTRTHVYDPKSKPQPQKPIGNNQSFSFIIYLNSSPATKTTPKPNTQTPVKKGFHQIHTFFCVFIKFSYSIAKCH